MNNLLQLTQVISHWLKMTRKNLTKTAELAVLFLLNGVCYMFNIATSLKSFLYDTLLQLFSSTWHVKMVATI